jgi:hypothetical protein
VVIDNGIKEPLAEYLLFVCDVDFSQDVGYEIFRVLPLQITVIRFPLFLRFERKLETLFELHLQSP